DREVLGRRRRATGGPRRAAPARRRRCRRRLPAPPLLHLGQGQRAHARIGHSSAAAARSEARPGRLTRGARRPAPSAEPLAGTIRRERRRGPPFLVALLVAFALLLAAC